MVLTKRYSNNEDGSATLQDTSIDDRDMQRMALPSELRVSALKERIHSIC